MPVIEEVNDEGTDGGQSASRSGSGEHTQSAGSSASTSAISRLMVCVISTVVIQSVIVLLELPKQTYFCMGMGIVGFNIQLNTL